MWEPLIMAEDKMFAGTCRNARCLQKLVCHVDLLQECPFGRYGVRAIGMVLCVVIGESHAAIRRLSLDQLQRFKARLPDRNPWKPQVQGSKDFLRFFLRFLSDHPVLGRKTRNPGNLRPVTIKPVGRIFEISDSNPMRGKCGKCGRSLSPQRNKGLRRSTTRKMQKRTRGKCGKSG